MNGTEMYADTRLDVPFFSQYADVKDAAMQPRACGAVCAYSTLAFFKADVGTLDSFISEGMRDGGYGPSGWFHDYLVRQFTERNVRCERREGMQDAEVSVLRDAIKSGNPVLVSAQRRMFDRRFFHMLVLTGVRENSEGALVGFFYHDPGDLDAAHPHRFVSVQDFLVDWRRMAILPD